MPAKVVLWASPRTCSTAFERAFEQTATVKVFHEPFVKAFLLGPDKKIPSQAAYDLYGNVDANLRLSYQDALAVLTTDYGGKDIFVKDMPFAIADCFEEFSNEELVNITHTFLIRSPMKALKSFYRAWMENLLGKLRPADFDPNFIVTCFEKQLEFYNFVTDRLNKQPVIVDIEDLLHNPEGLLGLYCDKTGLKYDEKMLTWEIPAGTEIEKVPWKGFHKAALESKGFQIPKQRNDSLIPEDVMEKLEICAMKCQEAYQTLHDKRLKLN